MDLLKSRYFEWVPGLEHSGLRLPHRQTSDAAGYDLSARMDMEIPSGVIRLVPTGVRVKLSEGEFLALYARSSLAIKRHLFLANGVGVIDRDYYDNPDNGGEILIPLLNTGADAVVIPRGERIAQGVFTNFLLSSKETTAPDGFRHGGFGSTGVN